MPHIHTQPGQHDITVSAYIVRQQAGAWLCLVHMHKKIDMLMQIGGHIELNETPWQALAHELKDETGYDLAELNVLQPTTQVPVVTSAVVHPVPIQSNTHYVGDDHYHSDYCYGFVAQTVPTGQVGVSESTDLRWYTLSNLQAQANAGIALQDTVDIYRYMLSNLAAFHEIPASQYSLDKPSEGLTYKK